MEVQSKRQKIGQRTEAEMTANSVVARTMLCLIRLAKLLLCARVTLAQTQGHLKRQLMFTDGISLSVKNLFGNRKEEAPVVVHLAWHLLWQTHRHTSANRI